MQVVILTFPLPESVVELSLEEGTVLVAQSCTPVNSPALGLLEHSIAAAASTLHAVRVGFPISRRKAGEASQASVKAGVFDGALPVHTHMSLFSFELVMLLLLGVSLPLVYWRKIRIRHL